MDPEINNQKKRQLIKGALTAAVIAVIIAIAGFSYLELRKNQSKNTIPLIERFSGTSHEKLLNENEAYNRGELFRNSQKYTDAIKAYTEAMPQAESNREKGQIAFKIALSNELSGKYEEAIRLYKENAANEIYMPLVRAYSVEAMGRIYYSNHSDQLTDIIFSDEPYKSMRIQGEPISTTYRRLFEYAASFYETAYSEFRIAQWYANKLVSIKGNKILSQDDTDTIDKYRKKINSLIIKATEDISRIQKDDIENIVPTLNRYGSLLATLELAGENQFGSAEQIFSNALEKTNYYKNRGHEGFVRFNYAAFLAKKYNTASKDDIGKILAPLSLGEYANTGIINVLKNERDTKSDLHKDIVLLSGIDTEFKKLLGSLGWTSFK